MCVEFDRVIYYYAMIKFLIYRHFLLHFRLTSLLCVIKLPSISLTAARKISVVVICERPIIC